MILLTPILTGFLCGVGVGLLLVAFVWGISTTGELGDL